MTPSKSTSKVQNTKGTPRAAKPGTAPTKKPAGGVGKFKAGKNIQPRPKPAARTLLEEPAPCECCPDDCAGAVPGTVWVWDGDKMVAVPPPDFFGVWVFDPTKPSGMPYYERPQNFPDAILAAMMAALVANMDSTTTAALAAALAGSSGPVGGG